jgi:hypothetical protein
MINKFEIIVYEDDTTSFRVNEKREMIIVQGKNRVVVTEDLFNRVSLQINLMLGQ